MGALPIRKITLLIPVAVWFCLYTSGCFHDQPDIEAKAEHPVEIRLPANPSTGYRWMLDPPMQSGRSLAESYEPSATDGRVGAPGTQILRVVFPREGRFNLKLAYRRLWEPVSVPPAQTTNLVVKVLPAKGDRTLMEKLFTKDVAGDLNIPQPESEEEQPPTPGRRVELKRSR